MGAPQKSNGPSGHEVTAVVDELIADAIRARASDIHIEPQENELLVRVRVDGQLKVRKRISKDLIQGLTSRIKVMAGMSITERRTPQDGRIRVEKYNKTIDLRVATSPMVDGEKIVMRAINSGIAKMRVDDIGYSEQNLKIYKQLISLPHGLVLHCGPTGSGKTTALYTALNRLNKETRNIHTIEDPVEIRLKGLNQAQVNTEVGLTFASILRSYLRQDCDVILVGEIRDVETANLAVQASLTGHLILGTLHCNSSVGAVSRLRDLDVGPFFVGTALNGVVYQRLVRRLCAECKDAYFPVERIARALGIEEGTQIFRARGCRSCNKTGYRGRTLIQEVLKIDDAIRDAIFDERPLPDIEKLARDNATLIPIFEDGLWKAREGITSVEEVARVVKGANLGK